MKKITVVIMTVLLLLSIVPSYASLEIKPAATSTESASPKAEADAMISRLKEIKAMDKSTLTSENKKELRNEVKTIKRNLRDRQGGIYLSLGAVIIIILLLIILL